jgi:hypothetical protein
VGVPSEQRVQCPSDWEVACQRLQGHAKEESRQELLQGTVGWEGISGLWIAGT